MSQTGYFQPIILSFLPVSFETPFDRPSHNLTSSIGPFRDIEEQHPDMVAVDSRGQITGQVMDFRES